MGTGTLGLTNPLNRQGFGQLGQGGMSISQSFSQSLGQGLGQGFGQSFGQTLGQGFSQGFGQSLGQGLGQISGSTPPLPSSGLATSLGVVNSTNSGGGAGGAGTPGMYQSHYSFASSLNSSIGEYSGKQKLKILKVSIKFRNHCINLENNNSPTMRQSNENPQIII